MLDATTQTGYSGTPLIEINGTNAGGLALKLSGNSGGSTIKGFTINRCGKLRRVDPIGRQHDQR